MIVNFFIALELFYKIEENDFRIDLIDNCTVQLSNQINKILIKFCKWQVIDPKYSTNIFNSKQIKENH